MPRKYFDPRHRVITVLQMGDPLANEFFFTQSAEDVLAVRDYLGIAWQMENADRYNSFFVLSRDGEWVMIYGMTQCVPHHDFLLYRLTSVTPEIMKIFYPVDDLTRRLRKAWRAAGD